MLTRRFARCFRVKEIFHANDQILRLKRLSDQLIRLHRHRSFRDRPIYDPGHQDDGRLAELFVLLDEFADFVTVLVWHDHVRNDGVGHGLGELRERSGSVCAGDYVDVFLAKGNLDHLAHGGAVVNKIDGRSTNSREGLSFAHCDSFSTSSRSSSSNSRMASINKSVAERSTVRCAAVAP